MSSKSRNDFNRTRQQQRQQQQQRQRRREEEKRPSPQDERLRPAQNSPVASPESSYKAYTNAYAKYTNSRLIHFNNNNVLKNNIDQMCYYVNEKIIPSLNFEDEESHLLKSSEILPLINETDTLEKILRDPKVYEEKNVLLKKYKNNIFNKYVYVYSVPSVERYGGSGGDVGRGADYNGGGSVRREKNLLSRADLVEDMKITTGDVVDFMASLTGENNFGHYATLSEIFDMSDVSTTERCRISEKNKNCLIYGDEILMCFKTVPSTVDFSVFHALFECKIYENAHVVYNSMYNVCKEIIKTNMNKNDLVSAYYVEMLFVKHLKTFFKDGAIEDLRARVRRETLEPTRY